MVNLTNHNIVGVYFAIMRSNKLDSRLHWLPREFLADHVKYACRALGKQSRSFVTSRDFRCSCSLIHFKSFQRQASVLRLSINIFGSIFLQASKCTLLSRRV